MPADLLRFFRISWPGQVSMERILYEYLPTSPASLSHVALARQWPVIGSATSNV
jgi:hypothetical protein